MLRYFERIYRELNNGIVVVDLCDLCAGEEHLKSGLFITLKRSSKRRFDDEGNVTRA